MSHWKANHWALKQWADNHWLEGTAPPPSDEDSQAGIDWDNLSRWDHIKRIIAEEEELIVILAS